MPPTIVLAPNTVGPPDTGILGVASVGVGAYATDPGVAEGAFGPGVAVGPAVAPGPTDMVSLQTSGTSDHVK